MPVRVAFRCQFCAAEPDEETRRSLEAGLLELLWGQYVNAPPGQWLVWHGHGPYGPNRFACPEHRVTLRTFLRKTYGTIGWHPDARVLGDVPPHVREQIEGPASPRPTTTARQRALARRNSGFGLI